MRGYLEAEELADKAIKTTVQLNSPVLHRHDRALGDVYGFFDYGQGTVIDPLPGEPGGATLHSFGFGFDVFPGQRLTGSVTWAKVLDAGSVTTANSSRVLFLLRGSFYVRQSPQPCHIVRISCRDGRTPPQALFEAQYRAWRTAAARSARAVPGALAGTQLPLPCLSGSCGTHASSFVSQGAATAVQSGNTLSVNQTTKTATLNWASFNISSTGKVVFQQPSSSAIALNRIFDSNPSAIFGSLSANGQIYLINANGFLFGSSSRVNVAGMIASSLNMTDGTLAAGILAPPGFEAPALQPFTDSNNKPIVNTGTITVQNGAQLTAADGGRLLLAAPTIQNSGTLSTPDGQIVLAAGQSVFLQASDATHPARIDRAGGRQRHRLEPAHRRNYPRRAATSRSPASW